MCTKKSFLAAGSGSLQFFLPCLHNSLDKIHDPVSFMGNFMHVNLSRLVYLCRLSRFVLDVSALKGGAPGRTRGLNLYALDTSANGVDEIN